MGLVQCVAIELLSTSSTQCGVGPVCRHRAIVNLPQPSVGLVQCVAIELLSTCLNPVWGWSSVCPHRAIVNLPQPSVVLILKLNNNLYTRSSSDEEKIKMLVIAGDCTSSHPSLSVGCSHLLHCCSYSVLAGACVNILHHLQIMSSQKKTQLSNTQAVHAHSNQRIFLEPSSLQLACMNPTQRSYQGPT